MDRSNTLCTIQNSPVLAEDMTVRETASKGFGKLKWAIYHGHRGIVESLLENETPVNNRCSSTENFRSPLHSSIYLGEVEIVKKLLDQGASVNVNNKNYETALMLAAKFEKYDIVDLLLSNKGLKNCVNRENFTHLHIACMRNQVDVVKKLLEYKVYVNIAVKSDAIRWSGYTPLHFAVEFKSIETVAFLLEVGADVTIRDSRQLTALHLADMKRNDQMIDMILVAHKRVTGNPVNSEGLSHFHIACTRNNREIVECFIRNGVTLNAKVDKKSPNWPKFTAIDFAIYYDCIDVVKLLLVQGGRKTFPSKYEFDLVEDAYHTGDLELVDSILQRDKLTEGSCSHIDGPPALHYSCIHENLSDVQGSLSKMPDSLNTPMWQGSTPLHLAVERRDDRIITYLLEKGADYNIKNADGKSPLHLAFERNLDPIVNSFLGKLDCIKENPTDNDGFSHFHIACIENNVRAVAKFMKLGVDVNQSVNFDSVIWPGFTPLHLAAKFEATKVARILLEHGASYSATNHNDLTAFDEAVLGLQNIYENNDGVFDIMRAILSAHLKHKIESFNDRGYTLLHLLYNDPLNGTRDMKEFIQEHQADINKAIKFPGTPWDGYTPLHFSMLHGETDHAELLVKMGADLSSKSANGDYPYHLAIYRTVVPQVPMTTLDFDKMQHNPIGSSGHSLFHVACAAGNLEWIKYFVDHGIDTNIRTLFRNHEFYDKTPLHVVTSIDGVSKLEVVKLLVENGTDVSVRDSLLNTPLHEVVDCLDPKVIDFFVSHGVDVNSRNAYLETPLYTNCMNSFWPDDKELSEKIVKLLNVGADINIANEWDVTPLSYDMWKYTRNERPLSMEALLKHVIKLRRIGFYISENNEKAYIDLLEYARISPESKFFEYAADCTKELEVLKEVRLNAYTSLYDVFFKDLNGLSVMSKNDEFQRVVKSEDFEEKYPIYGPMLILQLKKGQERTPLLAHAGRVLRILLRISVPRECTEQISRYLSNEDLKNIIMSTVSHHDVPGSFRACSDHHNQL